jgi:hypothetical protein
MTQPPIPLPHSATWKRTTAKTARGPSVQSSTSLQCLFSQKRRLVKSAAGKEVQSEAQVRCLEALAPDDTLTYGGRDYVVITEIAPVDFEGASPWRRYALGTGSVGFK